ncbi:hypothetical protein M885DRAFT_207837 [Pelagophyceae sp. CCMP2097]|nr:hypothetical protein M885DRAFT_207837 [Pelagophyceae sp. CCMP2097]
MPAAPSLGAFFTAAAPRPSTSWLVEPPSPRCPPRPSEAPPPRSAAFSYPKRRTSVGTAAPRAARRRKPRPRDGALAVAKVARPPKTLSPPRRAPAFVEALISLPGDDFDAGGDTEAYVDRMMSAAQEPYDDELRGDAPPASQAESEASTDGELSEASGPSDDEAAAAPPAAFIHTMVAARVEALDAAFSGPNTFSPRYEAVPRGDSLRRRRPPPRDAGPPHYDLLPPAAPPVAPLASMEDRRWRCPCGAALDYSVRAGHLADCSLFKDAWEEAHLDVVERLGVPAMRRLVGKVSMHHLCGEAEAFCALAHHGGDVHLAVGHLATADYRSEMQLAAETYDNTKLLAPKPRRKLVYYNRAPDAAEG